MSFRVAMSEGISSHHAGPPGHTGGQAQTGSSTLPQPQARITGLDGLRAISIIFVLFGHLIGTRGFAIPPALANAIHKVPLAMIGVRTFFVISGFLITTLLIEEERRTGTISLTRFYFRRTLRIFPPFYAFVLVMLVLSMAGQIVLPTDDVVHALTYTTNYHRHRVWQLGHTWSLSVEEQFYLLWPFLYRALRQHRAKVLTAYIIAAPVWRLIILRFLPAQQLGVGETFFTTADALAVGCLLALVRPRLSSFNAYKRLVDSPAYLLIIPAVLVIGLLERYALLDFAVLISAQNVLIAIFIERVTRTRQGIVAAILNSKPAVLIGVWSYSIYLWQQLFLNRNVQDRMLTAFPTNLLFAFILAGTSYYVIERPALRLRQRLEMRIFNRPRMKAGSERTAA